MEKKTKLNIITVKRNKTRYKYRRCGGGGGGGSGSSVREGGKGL